MTSLCKMFYYKSKNVWTVQRLSGEYKRISHLENNLVEKEQVMFINSFTKLLLHITKDLNTKQHHPYPYYFLERFLK